MENSVNVPPRRSFGNHGNPRLHSLRRLEFPSSTVLNVILKYFCQDEDSFIHPSGDPSPAEMFHTVDYLELSTTFPILLSFLSEFV